MATMAITHTILGVRGSEAAQCKVRSDAFSCLAACFNRSMQAIGACPRPLSLEETEDVVERIRVTIELADSSGPTNGLNGAADA